MRCPAWCTMHPECIEPSWCDITSQLFVIKKKSPESLEFHASTKPFLSCSRITAQVILIFLTVNPGIWEPLDQQWFQQFVYFLVITIFGKWSFLVYIVGHIGKNKTKKNHLKQIQEYENQIYGKIQYLFCSHLLRQVGQGFLQRVEGRGLATEGHANQHHAVPLTSRRQTCQCFNRCSFQQKLSY